jgi:UDP-N-acetylglucosamine pyrophosphorylase
VRFPTLFLSAGGSAFHFSARLIASKATARLSRVVSSLLSNGRNDHRTATADSAVQPYSSTDAEQIQKANQSRLVRSKTQPTAAQDFLAEKSTGSVHELYVSAHWTKNSI